MAIRFGPAGLGSVKHAINNLNLYHKLGLKACEIAFTYGIYIKENNIAQEIGKEAEKLGIKLSIHAPYWLNLNSSEKIKISQSMQRILDCCKIGEKLNAHKVVFHAGFYGKTTKEQAYENIKNAVQEIQDKIIDNSWKIQIAPETMGKINVFGSIEEIENLAKDTKCSFCLDFAHMLARYKEDKFELIKEKFNSYKEWHCHYSGIAYGEKGEKNHILTSDERWQLLLKALPKKKEIIIINESPDPIGDSIKGLRLNSDS